MYYPGDRVPFLLSLAKADGSEAEITTAPRITILNAFDNSALDIGGAGVKTVEMFTVAGSDALYTFLWDTAGVADGPYFALVSYSANGVTVNNRLLGFVQLGDSRVRGEVSLEATAAKTIDLPAKADFLVKSDYVSRPTTPPSRPFFPRSLPYPPTWPRPRRWPRSPPSSATCTTPLWAPGA
jgi:hypothetical protein